MYQRFRQIRDNGPAKCLGDLSGIGRTVEWFSTCAAAKPKPVRQSQIRESFSAPFIFFREKNCIPIEGNLTRVIKIRECLYVGIKLKPIRESFSIPSIFFREKSCIPIEGNLTRVIKIRMPICVY